MNEIETQAVHRSFGTPIAEWIAHIPTELAVDAVGLWQIVPIFRTSFGLSGAELIDRTRQAVLALLHHRAAPVVGCAKTHAWMLKSDYGTTPEAVADAVIGEWLASGRDPDVGDVWFALPFLYEADPVTERTG